MQSRQLTDLIKGLKSKHLESLVPSESKLQNSGKTENFMLRQADQHETNGEWEDYTFTFDEWDYNINNHKGDELIIIVGSMGKNYVNDIYVYNISSIDVMYKYS